MTEQEREQYLQNKKAEQLEILRKTRDARIAKLKAHGVRTISFGNPNGNPTPRRVTNTSPLPRHATFQPRTVPHGLRRWKNKVGPVWSYGVTTNKPDILEGPRAQPYRRLNLLPQSLQSLKGAGFDKPILFVDNESEPSSWRQEFGLEVVCRYPRIRAFGNWILALGELMLRQPWADYYAIFQDDILVSKNLRQYIERTQYPDKGYLNLYTFPENQALSRGRTGFYMASKQMRGLGALGLVFDHDAAVACISDPHMATRNRDFNRGHKFIDGGVVDAMRNQGYSEFVHNPSLVQHTGFKSTLNNPDQPTAISFQGEGFDCLSLLQEEVSPDASSPNT